MLTIDGAQGEGGGQVLRTSLALSAVTGKPFRIEHIRGRRNRPGLLRQHLTAVKAIAQVCDARVSGAELGAQTLVFEPNAVKHGEYCFAVGTAGSATLVLQTLMPALLMAHGRTRVVVEGGTHNPMAPSFDFIAQTFLPLLQRMGVSASAELVRPGFYPAGGGRIEVELTGGCPLRPLELMTRGAIDAVYIRAVVSQLSDRIAEREMKVLANLLADYPIAVETATVESAGPGNVATVTVRAQEVTETFTAFGEVGVTAEQVAHRLAGQVHKYFAHAAPVGEHLADQLMIPLALAGAGRFCTGALSPHAITNAEVIARFLPVKIAIAAQGEQQHVVSVASA